jgi:hypothetical protein
MKNRILIILLAAFSITLSAQQTEANYDEAKVPVFKLPDPLIFNNGSKVMDKGDWTKRRSEILEIFKNEMYGNSPEWKGKIESTEISSDISALNGSAIRKEIKLTLKNGNRELDMVILMYLPHSAKPVPLFVGYNFGGNHTVTDENDISITTSWMRNNEVNGVTDHKATETGRGKAASRWQVNEIISRGYGLITIYYGDVDPDFDDGFKNGVHGLYDQKPSETSWGTISGWAWGLSRVMDWIETNSAIDNKRVAVIGHSRLGKTSLWAGASDERFALVISNNSGCGGAALSNRKFGETVAIINNAFPHWFCDNFNKYSGKEESLPVDQHELIALMAPRPVYVASAEDDKWADPKGEFLACLHASPVFKLLGYSGFPATNMPAVNAPVTGTIGYHIRTGGHDVKLYDWQQYLDFADQHLSKK